MRTRTAAITRSVATLLVVSVVAVGLVGCQPVRPVDRTRPVLFVHGYEFWSASSSCSGAFDTMISRLRAKGFTGPMVKVGFYSGDTGCDLNLRSYGSYDDRDSWRQIAKAFAAYVRTTYTAKGIAVDVVGHSMGALIVRGAIHGTQRGEAGFGSRIDVQDFLSLAGPHAGAAWYSYGCLWGQCSALKPGSDDIDWLNLNLDPQGSAGTESTVVGSRDDAVVPSISATYMGLPPERKVVYSGLGHSDYMGNTTVLDRAAAALAGPGA